MLNLKPSLGERHLVIATVLQAGYAFYPTTSDGVKGLGLWKRYGQNVSTEPVLFWDGAFDIYNTRVMETDPVTKVVCRG
jgi:hypothetical protein